MLRATTSINTFSALSYQGTWNASTNTPTLVSSVGTAGYYYIVSVAGSTSLNGISTWNVGDWVIFSNTGVWQRIAGGVTGTINVTNDTSSNTNYNLALTNISSGTASTLYVDSPGVYFNPSSNTLTISRASGANLILSSNTDNLSTSLIIDAKTNSSTNTIGSSQIVFSQSGNNHWAFGGQNIGFGIPNTNYIGIWCYDNNTSPLNITPTGAWSISGTTANNWTNFGTAGQVLTSNGPSAAVSWSNPAKTPATTYSGLGSASTAGAGARGFITDCTTTTFLATAAGGGSNPVPVVSNGTNWLVG